MVKTGRDFGVFGGALALLTGFLILTVGLSLIRFGEFPPPEGAQEITAPGGFRETVIILLGAACIAGGALGIAGGAFAVKKPAFAAKIMTAAAALALVSVFGLISGVLLCMGGFQAYRFSKEPPGTEPEWQDVESLPY